MLKLLKAGGRLVSIMSSMAGERDDKKNKAFNTFLDSHSVDGEKLPDGTFLKSINSTGVSTKIVVLEKNINLSTQDRVDAEGETMPSWFVLDSVDNLPAASVEMMDSTEFAESLSTLKSQENGYIRAYYFEAKRYGLPDEKAHQLLLSGELPEAVKLEIDGLRMRAESTADNVNMAEDDGTLENTDISPIETASNPDFIPTHTLDDGTEVEPHPEENASFVDSFGNEYQDEAAIAIPDAGNPKPMPPANEALPIIEYLDAPNGGKDFGRINEQAVELGGLNDWPIRVNEFMLKPDFRKGDDFSTRDIKESAKSFGIQDPLDYLKHLSSHYSKIYKINRGRDAGKYLLYCDPLTTNGFAASIIIEPSEHGSFYDIDSTANAYITKSHLLQYAVLVWEHAVPKPLPDGGVSAQEGKEAELSFITFSKPFSPQKLFEKTNVWNERGRHSDVYAALSKSQIAELWAWMKFTNSLYRYPQYRYYSWDTDKSFSGGLNTALMQTGGIDHLNEVQKALENGNYLMMPTIIPY